MDKTLNFRPGRFSPATTPPGGATPSQREPLPTSPPLGSEDRWESEKAPSHARPFALSLDVEPPPYEPRSGPSRFTTVEAILGSAARTEIQLRFESLQSALESAATIFTTHEPTAELIAEGRTRHLKIPPGCTLPGPSKGDEARAKCAGDLTLAKKLRIKRNLCTAGLSIFTLVLLDLPIIPFQIYDSHKRRAAQKAFNLEGVFHYDATKRLSKVTTELVEIRRLAKKNKVLPEDLVAFVGPVRQTWNQVRADYIAKSLAKDDGVAYVLCRVDKKLLKLERFSGLVPKR